jgi:hypothetical protein
VLPAPGQSAQAGFAQLQPRFQPTAHNQAESVNADRELITGAQAGTLLAIVSVAGLAGAVLLGMLGKSKGSVTLRQGALLSAVAVLLYPLWVVYNAIEDHFGLDSVAALLINLALFVVLGVAGGLAVRRLWPKT